MTHAKEKLDVMDTFTSLSKKKKITLSRPVAAFILVVFVVSIVTTGLLCYYLSPRVTRLAESSYKMTLDMPTEELFPSEEPLEELDVVGPAEDVSEKSAVAATTTTTTEVSAEEAKPNPRLPTSIKPIYYEIFILPFIYEGNFTFNGNVSIKINVLKTTRNITLHAIELTVGKVEVLTYDDERVVPIESLSNDTTNQFFIINLNRDLTPGQYWVKLRYVGILNDALQGFYRSSYVVNKQTRWAAVTQFQPTDARRAFPCFDEPALKAQFQINVGREATMSSISNMPKLKTIPIEGHDGYFWDKFETSIPMSTYLVAFFVSDFEHLTNGSVSVWFRKGAANQAAFSLQIGPALLRHYEEFFNIKFPLPKMDMIALPDFSTGAMENWGMITYRESALLYEPGISNKGHLQGIAIVVAHELAHQWFGNLVTPTWWTDLWLNEGFASYMEYLGADAVCPDMKILDNFVVQEMQNVFALDSLKSSHPISVEVNNPDEINNIFDKISYSKGATIIRMMENFLTTPVFRKGLHSYLSERKYSNAEQDDLWASLTNQAHADKVLDPDVTVKRIMDTWTLQTGYPLVTVSRDYKNAATLTQERYLMSGKTNDTTLWWVPISYKTKGDQNVNRTWLRNEREIKINVNAGKNDWLLVNVNQSGYYRVNYDVDNWKLLVKELNSKRGVSNLNAKNRAQLLDDSFHLAFAGYISYDVPLNLTRYLVYEKELVAWRAAFNAFDYLFNVFVRSGQFDKFKKYFLYLTKNLYDEIGFSERPNDSTLTIYTRSELLRRVCLLGYRDCIINSIQEFQKWRTAADPDHSNPISPNLRGIVYCTAINAGGQEEWDFAWERYQRTEVSSEKDMLLTALSCSKEPWILTRLLELSITENSGIRKQDILRVFSSIGSDDSVIGQHIVYTFLRAKWKEIKEYVGASSLLLSGVLSGSITAYPNKRELDDIKSFIANNVKDPVFIDRTLQQIIELGEANLNWRNKNFDYIVNWLTQNTR